jgi:L1 cell adhesion molecule like protein
VLATDGDTHLGGQDFDTKLLELCYSDIERRYSRLGADARQPKATARLRVACEQAKRDLSVVTETTISVNAFVSSDEDYEMKITRAKFEDLCLDLFEETLDTVKEVLASSGLQKQQIDDVILVGGSTRIPRVQQLVKDYFDGKQPLTNINPDEAVAYGAAVLAQSLSSGSNVKLHDVTSLALGVEVRGELMSTVVEKNTTIPVKITKRYTTTFDDQKAVDFEVYEGQRSCTRFNKQLGSFVLDGIPPALAGKPKLDVTFDIDDNGILKVSAVNKDTLNMNSITIGTDRAWSSREEVQRMMDESRVFERQDKEYREKAHAKNKAEEKLYKAKRLVAEKSSPLLKLALGKSLVELERQFQGLSINPETGKAAYELFEEELLTFMSECS